MVGVAGAWQGRERGVAAVGAGTPLGVLESAGSLSTSGTWVQTGLAPLRGCWGAPAVMWGGRRAQVEMYMFLYSKKKKRERNMDVMVSFPFSFFVF